MPDLKITVSRTFGPYQTYTTTYLKPDRKRVEEQQGHRQQLWVGGPAATVRPPRVATITRCDLGQIFQLNLDDREYTSRLIPKPLSAEEQKARAQELRAHAAQGPQLQRPAEPNLVIEIATVDTGERKQMFGYTARHVVTTEKRTPLEGAVSPPQEQVYRWLVHRSRYFHLLRSAPAAGRIRFCRTRHRQRGKNRLSHREVRRPPRNGICPGHNPARHAISPRWLPA